MISRKHTIYKKKQKEKGTKKTRAGMGVKVWMLISAKALGKWPSLAPTKTNLEAANMDPFKDPNVDEATNRGMIHAIGPRMRSPNDFKMIFKNKFKSLA